MMTDDELIDRLAELGIGPSSYQAVLLLPLIQVAWADGRVQGAESEIVLQAATRLGIPNEAYSVVYRWLDRPPSESTLLLGRQVLVELSHRHRGLGSEVEADAVERVLHRSRQVAESAGGLFGFAFTVSSEEKQVLEEITRALHLASNEWLDDLPTPQGGRFEDL